MSDAKTLVGIAVAFTIISSLVANNFGAMLGGLVVFLAGLFFLVVLVSYLVEKVRNRPGPRLHIYKRIILSLNGVGIYSRHLRRSVRIPSPRSFLNGDYSGVSRSRPNHIAASPSFRHS